MLYVQKKAVFLYACDQEKTLDAYAAQYPDAAEPLRSWWKLMERQDFRALIAMPAVWPTADFVDPYTILSYQRESLPPVDYRARPL